MCIIHTILHTIITVLHYDINTSLGWVLYTGACYSRDFTGFVDGQWLRTHNSEASIQRKNILLNVPYTW